MKYDNDGPKALTQYIVRRKPKFGIYIWNCSSSWFVIASSC